MKDKEKCWYPLMPGDNTGIGKYILHLEKGKPDNRCYMSFGQKSVTISEKLRQDILKELKSELCLNSKWNLPTHLKAIELLESCVKSIQEKELEKLDAYYKDKKEKIMQKTYFSEPLMEEDK